jgi:hypothetical protein
MARINQFEALIDDLHRAAVEKGIAVKKVVKAKPSRLAKSAPGSLEFFAKAGKGGVRIVASESAKPGTKLAVQGGKVVKPVADKPVDAEPREHTALRVARLLSEMKQHALGRDWNGKISEKQLLACHALSRAGEMSEDEVAQVKSAMDDGRALPSHVMRKLANT